MEVKEKRSGLLEKWKYPLIMLAVGVLVMLLPFPSAGGEKTADRELGELLSHAQGVGSTYVILSDNGVVVVCDGADRADVRLDVINAVSDYTGFGSDRITVLKNKDQK